jgi:hypothetical protein
MLAGAAHAQTPWVEFKWGTRDAHDPSSAHAAILLPVSLNGASCLMQFDTGADTSVLYRPMLPAAIRTDGPSAQVTLNVGGVTLPRQFPLMYPDDAAHRSAGCREGDYGRLAGTLSGDAFKDGAIELDLKQARFRIFKAGDARPSLSAGSQRMPFTPGQAANVPIVTAHLPDGRAAPLRFDTGSVAVDLLVFRQPDWLALVGRAQAGHATRTESSSWGQPIVCLSAPLQAPIRFDGLELPKNLQAAYCAAHDRPAFAGLPEYGVLGLNAFHDNSLVIDFAAHTIQMRAGGSCDNPAQACNLSRF